MTRREATLAALSARPNAWVSGLTLVEAGSGWRYSARIWELRQAGHVIEERPDPEKRSAVHQYRLVLQEVDPGQIPLPLAEVA